MATAKIVFSEKLRKFTAVVGGKVIAKSGDKYYLRQRMKQAGYEIESSTAVAADTPPKPDEFGINKRFEFVKKLVSMVGKKAIASAVITGAGGLGKSHTVMKALDSLGLVNVSDAAAFEVGTVIRPSKAYRVIKGFSTAKGLYRSLFESNGMVLVFDDCDSVLKDPVAVNLLKGALDSYSKRYISWNADMRDEDLPRSFEFTGSVVFISNLDLDSLDQAIRTRAMCADVSMTDEQKVERMEVIVTERDFMPEFDMAYKRDAVAFIKSMVKDVSNLSLRSLISTIKIRAEGGDWKDLAKYVLTQGA